MSGSVPKDYYMRVEPHVVDWCGMVDFAPDTYHAPGSIDAVADILTGVLRQERRPRTLRILGGMHSCSTIFESDTVIDVRRLPLDFAVTSGPAGVPRVVASAFMHVHDFNQRAGAQGLSLTALGGTDAQTLAGLIATNTAGATIRNSVYETLAWVEFLTVTADGKSIETRTVVRDDPDFPGMIASLGAIGMMTRVAFDLVPQRFFHTGQELKSLMGVLGDLDGTNAQYDFWRIEWLPGNDDLGNFWWATQMPGGLLGGDYPDDKLEPLLRQIIDFDDKAFNSGPLLNPLLKGAYEALIAAYQPTKASGPLRNMIPLDRNAAIKVAMAEWSIAPADLPRVMDVCRAYWAKAGFPNLSTEIQCTRKDDYFMSAWNWPDVPQSYIVKLNFQYITDALDGPQKAAILTHLKGLWDALDAAGIVFKAHWGKINFLDAARVSERYQASAFTPLVKPLFLNDYLKDRLPL